MIAGLSIGSQILNNSKYSIIAKKAADFILNKMVDPDGRLFHRYRNEEVKTPGFADDYAYFIWGLIELYESIFDSKYLEKTLHLTDYALDHFWDETNHGIFFISDDSEKLLIRKKEYYDGAYPSSNSVMMMNLLRLSKLTGNHRYIEKVGKIGKSILKQIEQTPAAYTNMMNAIEFMTGKKYEIIIVGNKDNKNTKKMITKINKNFFPNKVILLKEPGIKDSRIIILAPFVKNYTQLNDSTTVYICVNQLCKKPITDYRKIDEILN